MSDKQCRLQFNCLSAEVGECKCSGFICQTTSECPKETMIGKYILLAVGFVLLAFGIPALLIAKTYRFVFDDETKSASYARYNPVLRCFKRGQKDIPYEELNEITCNQFVHTDRYSAASKYVQLEMPDGYIFTFFVGNQTLADEELIRWRHFMEERINYEPEQEQVLVIQPQMQRTIVERPRRKSDDWMDEDIENAPNPFAGPPQLLTDSGSEDDDEHAHKKHQPQPKRRRKSLAPLPPVGHGRRPSVGAGPGGKPLGGSKAASPLRREASVNDTRNSITPPTAPQQTLLSPGYRGEALSDTHEESDTEQPFSDNNPEVYSDGARGREDDDAGHDDRHSDHDDHDGYDDHDQDLSAVSQDRDYDE